MIDTFLVLLPVFVVILVALALRLSGLIDGAHWDAVDHVCYYVLFPAIIFKEIAAADFSNVPVFAMAFAMVAALIADLFILRPTAMWLISTAQKLRGGEGAKAVL